MEWSAALPALLPTFVITLREGVEAALVVGIVLAYLRQADRRDLTPAVWWGVAVGLGASVGVGWGFNRLLATVATSDQPIAQVAKPLMEAGFGAIAIVLLSWMLVWMTQQAKRLKGELTSTLTQTTQSEAAGWGIFSLIAIAVLREGFETVVFISAQFQAGLLPVIGAVGGLIGAVAVGIALFRFGIRINLRQFFQVMGGLLLLIVAGLVVGMLHHLDAAAIAWTTLGTAPDWLACDRAAPSCLLGAQVWNTATILPDRQFPGVVLKALLGYRDHLYLAQVIGYTLFLATVGSLYFRSLGGAPRDRAST